MQKMRQAQTEKGLKNSFRSKNGSLRFKYKQAVVKVTDATPTNIKDAL